MYKIIIYLLPFFLFLCWIIVLEEERMLEGKALVQDTDMPDKMQIQAMVAASEALDRYDVFDCKSIAAHIKKVLSLPYLSL